MAAIIVCGFLYWLFKDDMTSSGRYWVGTKGFKR